MALPLFSSPSSVLRLGLGLGIGLSAATLHPLSPFRATPIQCQYAAPSTSQTSSETPWAVYPNDHFAQKQSITSKSRSGFLTASNMRQLSLGSVLGLVAGVGLRAFSRVLVVVLGMGIVFAEWAASKGYNIIPVNQIQKLVKSVDVQGVLSKQRPFKISFGLMMALGAFAHF
ncbi:hypothetical protein N7495_000934 [Penicillium taxi]|uniref:uncharacterized protein n=1 Tax=Penicillium taxi TaxID=168475 RepID=UPI002545A90E|nr:uncharacterized protein N7495_000934 [Penicillium taxi]KAJ5908252.1 hypothetical protein N7495_000934 [Penicillium taxi]